MLRPGIAELQSIPASRRYIQALPKVELHLEATPKLAILRSLATETGLVLPDEIEPDSEKSHEYDSLAHFIRVRSSVNSLYSTPQIYGRLLYEALRTLAQGSGRSCRARDADVDQHDKYAEGYAGRLDRPRFTCSWHSYRDQQRRGVGRQYGVEGPI